MNRNNLTSQQIGVCGQIAAHCRQSGQEIKAIFIALAFQAGIVSLIFTIEYFGIYDIYSYLDTGNNPDERVFSAPLLSSMGVVMVCCYHFLNREYGQSWIMRLQKASLPWFIFFYLFGLGIVFAVIVHQSGLEGLFNHKDFSFTDSVELAAQNTQSPWLKGFLDCILENGEGFLLLGFCGFSLICCYGVSQLWDRIERNLNRIKTVSGQAKEAEQAFTELLELEKRHAEYVGELEMIDHEIESLPDRFVHQVKAQAMGQYVEIEALLIQRETLPLLENQASEILQSQQDATLRKLDPALLKYYMQRLQGLIQGGIEQAIKNGGVTCLCLLLTMTPYNVVMSADTVPPFSIALDNSSSSPVLKSKAFALAAGRAIAEKIKVLPMKTRITVRTLGENGLSNVEKKEVVLSPKNRPSDIALAVGKMIATAGDTFKGQSSTYLLGFLSQTAFDCKSGETIVVVTDGLETSKDFMMNEKLLSKPFTLPRPKADQLKGCHVIFYGLGRTEEGLSASQIANLNAAWEAWFKTAGSDFTAIINF